MEPRLSEETIARTAASLVRRLERPGAGRVARVRALPELEGAVLQGLAGAGWRPAEPDDAADAALAFFPGQAAEWVDYGYVRDIAAPVVIVAAAMGEAPPGWTLRQRRRLTAVETLNAWLARRFAGPRSPGRGWKSAVWRCWTASFLARSIGEKPVKRVIPGNWVWRWVRDDQSANESPSRKWSRQALLAATTVCGLGFIAYFPGTWGALAGWLAALALHQAANGSFPLFWSACGAAAGATTLMCLATERWAGRYFGAKDPREFVLDEVAGVLTACLFLPADLYERTPATQIFLLITVFLAFRFFDILKLGVHWLERRAGRGAIVWDDLLAGVYAGLVAQAAAFLLR
ncbi:MAG TPA: phosphatidylglycerophosphatase A [Verrucomicrobiales bacterium]|nr:phosphatidylglycerophosphatase A [Verrucomicrobiales bacterium]